MPKFEYDDIVKIISSAPEASRPGLIAWIVGVHEERRGEFLKEFPSGSFTRWNLKMAAQLRSMKTY